MPVSSPCSMPPGRRLRPSAFAWFTVLAVAAAGCPTPPAEPGPEPEYNPNAFTPESSGLQNADLAAARQRIVPYDVERGTTVYAIRDLVGALPRMPAARDRAEATFLAAAATLDLVLYADLTADDRPLAGLCDAWGAGDRDGTVAAIAAALEGIGSAFVPVAVQNALVVARALRTRDHAASADPATLNALAAGGGPLAFAARVVALDVHAALIDRARREGSAVLLASAPALAAGLPEPPGEAFAALEPSARAAASLLSFAAANVAAVRAAAADEPLAAVLGSWLAARPLDQSPLEFALPVAASSFPGGAASLAVAPVGGRAPTGRVFLFVAPDAVAVGIADLVRVSGGTVDVARAPLGGSDAGLATCPVPEPPPEPPRRFTCLQDALRGARAAGGGTAERLIVAAPSAALPEPLVLALREAAAEGFVSLDFGGVDSSGALVVFPVSFGEGREVVQGEATVRIAPGGFYVGRRGNLTQVPRAGGAFDYAGLASTVQGREPPFVLAPSDSTTYGVLFGALAAISSTAAAVGETPVLLPPAGG